MTHPRISAVIPAYNSSGFLLRAINSILNQTQPVDEIIIVDDGSTDETKKVLGRLDHQIVYIYQDNAGPSVARNKGIECAKGDWIAFLDADDQWVHTKIEKQLQLIKKNPGLAFVAGDMAEINTRMEITVPSVLDKHGLKSFFEKNQDLSVPDAMNLLLKKNFIPTGTVLVKKEVITSVGSFNPKIRYGEDLELWAKVAATYPMACMPEVLMLRTRHETNATSATENMLKDLIQVMLSLKEWIKLNKMDDDINYYVSRAWADLGYFNFSANVLNQSKQYFLNSYIAKPSFKSLIYYAASLLSPDLVLEIRKKKKRLGKLNHWVK